MPKKASRAPYRRIVLKLSGEALQSKSTGFGIDAEVTRQIAQELKEVHALGVQIGIVIGGGNIYRGTGAAARSQGIDRTTGDYMGMLATVINALALQDALEKVGCFTRLQTAIRMESLAEPYIRRRAIRHLEKGRVVIFAGGTGNPYFSTDTAAALRAIEIGAEAILKATQVDGIYSSDPHRTQGAVRFVTLKHMDLIKKGLNVMDASAVTLCMEHKLPIVVFNLSRRGNIKRVLLGEKIGTVVQ